MNKTMIALTVAGVVAGSAAGLTAFAKKQTLELAGCMKNAVAQRDDAMISAVQAYNDAIVAALKDRKVAFMAAWDLTSNKDRNAANKSAVAAFQKSRKDASSVFTASKKAFWDQFTKDRKACITQ